MKCFVRYNHRKLMEEYVEKLGEYTEGLELVARHNEPNINAQRAPRAIKTLGNAFDRLSKNVLQNVMGFFNYKGTDFMKMRSINMKTKNSYMQELSLRFNAELSLKSVNANYV